MSEVPLYLGCPSGIRVLRGCQSTPDPACGARGSGFEVWRLGVGVWVLGFEVWCLVLGEWGVRCAISGLGLEV